MSNQFILTEYKCGEDGRLYEPSNGILRWAPVDQKLVELFSKEDLFEEFDLYEDSNFDSYSVATRLKSDQIGAALQCLTSMLIRLLESNRVDKLKTIQSETEISILMKEFQFISCAYQLITLYRDNFANSAAAVIMLG